MDIEKIRKDFPACGRDGLVYLDTAASSLTPTPVLLAVDEYYKRYRANIHRGLYREAQKATKKYEEARKVVADFIGAHADEVVFCSGATLASNMLFIMLENSVDGLQGGEIVTTTMEHHAMLLPLQRLSKKKGMDLKYVSFRDDFTINTDEFNKRINDKTKLVAITLASNVFGSVQDIKDIAKTAHDVGAIVVVDGTAGIGHVPVNVYSLGIDFMFFSGHKMCSPTGIGALFGKRNMLKDLEPAFVGGGIVDDVSLESGAVWTDPPERFEAGTQNIAGAIGFQEAIKYIDEIGLENIHKHCSELVKYTKEKLREIEGVHVYSAHSEKNVGIVSFDIKGVHPHDAAEILAQNGIAVRAGHHCAMPLHKELGIHATVRVSVYLYNTKEDIDILVEKIKISKKIFEQ